MLRTFAKHFYTYELRNRPKQTQRTYFNISKNRWRPGRIVCFFIFHHHFYCLFNRFYSNNRFRGYVIEITTPEALEALLAQNTTEILLLNTVVSVVLHFLLSGIYGMIIKSTSSPFVGLGAAFKALFSTRGMKAFLFITVLQIVVTSINYLLSISGLAMVGFVIGALFQFLTYFTLLIIYIENKSIVKSVSESVSIINSRPLFFMPIVLITYVVSLTGILLFGIGIIFTLPINFIVAYSLFTVLKENMTAKE